MIHWSYILFFGVLTFLIMKIFKSSKKSHFLNLETPFWVIILIAFILIYGGIFWW